MIEIWKPLKDYEGLYEISNMGNFKSLPKKGSSKILLMKSRHVDISTGYIAIQLHKNNKMLTKRIHRLVASTFIPNPNNYPVVNHIDGNKKNNQVDNLEWCTYSENSLHAINSGLSKPIWGEKHPQAKLSNKDLDKIKELFSEGRTNKEIAQLFNIGAPHISKIRNNKRRGHESDLKDYSITTVGHKGRVLTKENVLEIINMLSQGVQQKIIAQKFKIDTGTICNINLGKQYKNLPRPSNLPMRYRKSGLNKIATI